MGGKEGLPPPEADGRLGFNMPGGNGGMPGFKIFLSLSSIDIDGFPLLYFKGPRFQLS